MKRVRWFPASQAFEPQFQNVFKRGVTFEGDFKSFKVGPPLLLPTELVNDKLSVFVREFV